MTSSDEVRVRAMQRTRDPKTSPFRKPQLKISQLGKGSLLRNEVKAEPEPTKSPIRIDSPLESEVSPEEIIELAEKLRRLLDAGTFVPR